MSIEVKFSLNLARGSAEPSQILCSLFEHTGGQFTSGGLLHNRSPTPAGFPPRYHGGLFSLFVPSHSISRFSRRTFQKNFAVFAAIWREKGPRLSVAASE
jgi:hypothetical protein